MLMGLKRRNGFGEKALAAAVGTALHRYAAKRNCEDCMVKVARGAAINSGGPQGGSAVPFWAGDSYTHLAPNIHRISREGRNGI